MTAATDRNRLPWPALIGVLIGAAIMVAPLLWTLLLSLKSNTELMRDSASALSAPYTLDNYRDIITGSDVPRWLLNSLIVSLATTAGVLLLCSLAGYGFARLEFPFRRTLFVFVLLGLAIPEQAVILPRHQLFATLGWHNSYPGLILPGLAAPFGVFFMTRCIAALHFLESAVAPVVPRASDAWRVHVPWVVE